MDKAETILNMFKVAEKEAFQLLYSSYYETLVLFANQIIDDSQAAEDIVQDCLVKFWISKRYRTLESGLDKYRKNHKQHEYSSLVFRYTRTGDEPLIH